MGIKDTFQVRTVKPFECKDWLLGKHYAKRMPSISYAYGLYQDSVLVGVMTIGKPASPAPCVGVCGRSNAKYVYELNRLVVNDGLRKNVLSFFVAGSLKMIPNDLILLSYADTSKGHHGYIYQATNWVYTGLSAKSMDAKGALHNRHGWKQNKQDGERVLEERPRKHRYVYFLGKQRKAFRKALLWPIEPYPKGDNERYDASYEPQVQSLLFGGINARS